MMPTENLMEHNAVEKAAHAKAQNDPSA